MTQEQIAMMVKDCIRTGRLPDGSRACLLCNDPGTENELLVGVAQMGKEEQWRIGASAALLAKGGARLVIYHLCHACLDKPTSFDDVNDEILRRASVQ